MNRKQLEPAELEILEITGICVEMLLSQEMLARQHHEVGKRILKNVEIEGADERILRIMAISALKYAQDLREKKEQQPERSLAELVFEDADHISCRACGFAKELSSLKKTMRELEWELDQKRKKIEKAEKNFREAKEKGDNLLQKAFKDIYFEMGLEELCLESQLSAFQELYTRTERNFQRFFMMELRS